MLLRRISGSRLLKQVCSNGMQRRTDAGPISISDLQSALQQHKTKSSEGMEQLKIALEILAREVQEKKEKENQKSWDYFIIHIIGKERRGLIAEVSAVLAKHQVDIAASRATILGGDFSMMIHCRSTEDLVESLSRELNLIHEVSSWVHKAQAKTDDSSVVGPGRRVRIMRLSGNHVKGVVAGVTKLLRQRDVSIMNMSSELAPAPDLTGPPLFKMRLVCDLPADISKYDIETGLQALQHVLGTPITLESWHDLEDL
eukprot:Sspe_Gene.24309::Locus_9602_Transcript_3_4_Confidence_0.444_Length_1112::g.24309::m.24309